MVLDPDGEEGNGGVAAVSSIKEASGRCRLH